MKYLKLLGLALAAMCALSVATASSAVALPDISIALGGSYPLHNEVTLLTLKTKLSNPVEPLSGVGLLLLLLTKELTALGTFEALFLNVENAKTEKCNSEGDKTGEVLTSGSFHIVYTSLTPLKLGILFLPNEVKIECGKVKIKVKGSVLSSLNTTGSETEELTELGGKLTGNGSGVPTLTTYYNDKGESESAKLESNFGTGFKQSAEEAEKEVTTYALEGKMFVITSQ